MSLPKSPSTFRSTTLSIRPDRPGGVLLVTGVLVRFMHLQAHTVSLGKLERFFARNAEREKASVIDPGLPAAVA